MKLFSHIRGDDDVLEPWLRHYARFGVRAFHIILHGPDDENREIRKLASRYPVVIEHAYNSEYDDAVQFQLLTDCVSQAEGEWILVVDSDEFLELPMNSMDETIRFLEAQDSNVLRAPLLQRLARDGSLPACDPESDPSEVYPLCSPDLYGLLGQPQANQQKFPLMYCTSETVLKIGNHSPPNEQPPRESCLLGVSHHYKWRAIVRERLRQRAASENQFREESASYQAALVDAGGRLPLENAFLYSRSALFRRRLLRGGSLWNRLLQKLANARRADRGSESDE